MELPPSTDGTFLRFFDNPVFQTGIIVAVASLLWAQATYLFNVLGQYLVSQIGTSIDLGKESEAHNWILTWLSLQGQNVVQIRSYSLAVDLGTMNADESWKREMTGQFVGHENPKIKLFPGEGLHIVWFEGSIIFINRTIDTGRQASTPTYGRSVDNYSIDRIKLWTFGRRKEVLLNFTLKAMESSLRQDKGSTIIYEVDSSYNTWVRSIAKRQRSLESVILKDQIADDIVKDAKEFFNSQEWYSEKGVPFRRGYLFYGQPGCGKTSFTAALAGALGLNVCVLTLSKKGMNDQDLNQLLHSAPMNSIILLEDIDCAFPSRRKKKEEKTNMWGDDQTVTFSGLLNVLDGLGSQEGRIYIMTTNYIDRLDPALIRPGRVDRRVEFKLATLEQISCLFLKFYPTEKALASRFAEAVGPFEASMAQLQGHFLLYKNDPLQAYNDIPNLKHQIRMENEASQKKAQEEKDEEELEELEREEEKEKLKKKREERISKLANTQETGKTEQKEEKNDDETEDN